MGYLAGVTAGLFSTKLIVAVLAGTGNVESIKLVNGFQRGVISVCPG